MRGTGAQKVCATLALLCRRCCTLSLTEWKKKSVICGAVDKARNLCLEYYEEKKSSAHLFGMRKITFKLGSVEGTF